jgi:hypothetical protein
MTTTLRNEAAYDCFTLNPAETVLVEAPFGKQSGTPRNTAALNALDAPLPRYLALSESCDVPLALLYRDAQGIHFVDNWSVRRRVTTMTNASPWNVWVSDHQASEREAAFLQFQEQLADIALNEASLLSTLTASQRFPTLPPAGMLPADTWRHFLGTHAPIQETAVKVDLLPGILLQALQHRPFKVIGTPTNGAMTDQVITAVDVFRAGQSDFVVFACSMQGRLQFYFDNEPAQFNATMRLDHTNQEFDHFAKLESRPATIQGANMPPGSYHCSYRDHADNTQHSLLTVNLIAGRIIRKLLHSSSFNFREGFWLDLAALAGTPPIASHDFRLCLVNGAVQDAFIQRNDPNTERILGEMQALKLDATAREKLALWQEALYYQLRFDDIRRLEPTVFVDPLYQLPHGASGIPEIPQAYLVFGGLLIPLTISSVPRGRVPISLRAVFDNNGPGDFFRLHAPGTVSPTQLINDLEAYGIVSADQLAGAWIMLLAKITRLPDRDYRQLIWNTVRFLSSVP